jgi:drug/metabolite transporter (DMT)-like permease
MPGSESAGLPSPVEEEAAADRATTSAFTAIVLVAGGNAVSIVYIVRELDPFWAATMRFMLAALVFTAFGLASRMAWPRGRALQGAVLYGALTFGGAFGFFYWALARGVEAGLGQVILATVPLLTFALALAHRQERFRIDGLIGAALAVGGIAVIFRESVSSGVPLTALLSLIASAACFAEGAVVVKAFPPVHPALMNAVGMGVGAVIVLALSLTFGESVVIPERATTWIAQAYLVLPGSVGVFGLHVFVLRRWTASAASYEMVLIPLVTIMISAWLLDEKITASFAAGAALVLLGVYFGALRRRPSPDRLSGD